MTEEQGTPQVLDVNLNGRVWTTSGAMKNGSGFSSAQRSPRHAGGMSLLHCPLCIGLAVLSVLRAGSHLVLVGLRLSRVSAA